MYHKHFMSLGDYMYMYMYVITTHAQYLFPLYMFVAIYLRILYHRNTCTCRPFQKMGITRRRHALIQQFIDCTILQSNKPIFLKIRFIHVHNVHACTVTHAHFLILQTNSVLHTHTYSIIEQYDHACIIPVAVLVTS